MLVLARSTAIAAIGKSRRQLTAFKHPGRKNRISLTIRWGASSRYAPNNQVLDHMWK